MKNAENHSQKMKILLMRIGVRSTVMSNANVEESLLLILTERRYGNVKESIQAQSVVVKQHNRIAKSVTGIPGLTR